jgi:hypothetical protein
MLFNNIISYVLNVYVRFVLLNDVMDVPTQHLGGVL